jgi:polyhydroxybutyrate depolymerase
VPADLVVGGDRPAVVHVPASYDPDQPAPLLIMLHGYGSNSQDVEEWTNLGAAANERGWLAVVPDGTTDQQGDQFWNAGTPHCCNLFDSDVDDSAYLSGLIDEISDRATVDPKRVYVFGHSNGAFMAYRMACDHADQVAAVISMAGITIPEDICKPSEPVHTLQVHGTADESILYDGEEDDPSAPEMAKIWAAHDGCDPVPDTSAPPLDLDFQLEGAETRVLSYTQGCDPGGSATLWTVDGGQHQPVPTAGFRGLLLDFFEAHAKP